MAKKLTNADVDARLLGRNVYRIGNYIDMCTKIEFGCYEGHKWFAIPSNVLSRHGCRKCSMKKITAEDITAKLDGRNIRCIGEYTNVLTATEFECMLDGHKWSAQPKSVLEGKGCRKCAGNVRLTNADVDSRLVGRSVYRIGNIVGLSNNTDFGCSICGYKWSARSNAVIHGNGCRKCAKLISLTNLEIDTKLLGRDVLRIGDCINSKTKIEFECSKGHRWFAAPSIVIRVSGCKICAKTGFDPTKMAVIYVFNIDGLYCGYGISNVFRNRYTDHKRTFRNAGVTAELVANYDCSGFHAEKIENLLKKSFKVVNTGIDGFKREATHIENLPKVLDFINEQLKQCQ